MSKRAFSALLALALAFTGATAAQAQDPEAGEVSVSASGSGRARSSSGGGVPGPMRVYGGLHIGGGGNTKVMPENGPSGKFDAHFLVGFQAGLDYIIHDYVALGGEFRFTGTDLGGNDRALLTDLVFKPRGRYAFSNIPLEVYGTLPLGFDIFAGRNGTDAKFNMNFGIGGGAMYFFTDKLGINAEMTGIFHWRRDTVDGFGPIPDYTTRSRLGQFYWFTNVVYAL